MFKKELREIYKNKRADLSLDEIVNLSFKIEEQLMNLLSEIIGNNVNVFLSSESKKEVQTSSMIDGLLTQKKSVSVPVSNYKKLSITASLYKKGDSLTEDQFGIPAPTNTFIIDPKAIDIVVVPLLCFDKKGYRCGYGKGMYDRFLSKCNPNVITIGLSFFDAIETISDVNQFDMPMSFVITSTQTIRLNQ
ncbi:MAG: 5-formyltetrahydrofolate cyclo-ligase [Glaciecola sp.]|jgi:5-formyltetrahydrofolate cyclo-ligase